MGRGLERNNATFQMNQLPKAIVAHVVVLVKVGIVTVLSACLTSLCGA